MSLRKPVIFETAFTHYTGTVILGEGGAGRVYQATDDAGNVFAIKLLDPAKVTSEKRKRFKNEVEFGRRNRHQHIIAVIDDGVFIDGNKHSPFYVMPLYKGSLRVMPLYKGSLRTLLSTSIPPNKAPVYFAQILDGVEAAHLLKVIHRDLKPENILYDEAQDRLLIADFGIAHFEEELLYTDVETAPNTRLANFQYAAPEQRSRGAQVDHRADIYALGLILNEMFTGMVPHGTGYKTIIRCHAAYGYLDEIVSSMLRQSAGKCPTK
jgi:serine/threonine protein kinase